MVTFHEQFAEILGEGLPYKVFGDWGGPNGWMIRCYDEEGGTVRMIQYQIEDKEFRILSLYIADEPSGGNHILRIAAAVAPLFKEEGWKTIKANDFDSTPAGRSFDKKIDKIGGKEKDGKFSVIDVDDFQKIIKTKEDKDEKA